MSATLRKTILRLRGSSWFLTGLVVVVSLGFMLDLREPFAKAWQMVQYNRYAAGYDTHVHFWGKVVDQNGYPVEGATIAASVTTMRLVKIKGKYREYAILTAHSAADGSFKLECAEGFSLTIEQFYKDGYVLPSAYQAGTRWPGAKYYYRYKDMGTDQVIFTPSRSHPEVFHFWKLNKPEPLTIRGNGFGHSCIHFKVGAPPEVFRSYTVGIDDVGTPELPQWEVTVTAIEPDGGVIMADPTDIFMFQAPESGYTESIKLRYGPDGCDEFHGDPGASLRFFSRSHNGRWYGASQYAFFIPDRDGSVETTARFWRNPNGSRNLEHDGAHPLPEPRLAE